MDDDRDLVTVPLFDLADGTPVVVREPRPVVEARRRLLRGYALLARCWVEGYEEKLPPPERRTARDAEALRDHAARVLGGVARQAARVPYWGREWEDAVAGVAALTLRECRAEVCRGPLFAP